MKSKKSSPRTPRKRSATLIENCIRRIRGAIMIGDLRPGQKLVESELRRELGVSRASLREALRGLQAERLVDLVPNRGPSVSTLGDKEVEEIHDAWALLTGETVHRFAEVATPADLARLQKAMKCVRDSLRSGDHIDQLNATNAFFGYISEHCRNEVIIDMITSLVSRINFLRAQSLMHDGWRTRCAAEIEAIARAIRSRQPAVARKAVWQHIESACRAARNIASMPKPENEVEATHGSRRFPGMKRWTRAQSS